MDPDELRAFARGYLEQAGAGSQTMLAKVAGVPGGSLSKFLSGKSLAIEHRLKLQMAVGRAWPLEHRAATR
jgi:hypothetical protein